MKDGRGRSRTVEDEHGDGGRVPAAGCAYQPSHELVSDRLRPSLAVFDRPVLER